LTARFSQILEPFCIQVRLYSESTEIQITITTQGDAKMFKQRLSIREWLIIALLALSLVGCAAAAQAGASTESEAVSVPTSNAIPRTITVVGVGEINLVPDIAQINVGAEARAGTVSEAKAEVERQITAVVAALQNAGIDKKDIQTSHYSIHYEREPMPVVREGPASVNPVEEIRGGYRVSNMLRVTVRNVDQAGDILDAVVEAGANQIYGVTFTISDETEWQSKARENAMADAQARAVELAGLANVELGEVLSVSEVVGSTPVPMMAERAFGGGGIAPGEMELGTQLQVVFAIQ
jgi:uncharacterized protein YggE